jgi:prolyl-tRNA editing enzyme YbaK/EbsC (Cys-tRNA(Pro) deacylase)
VSLPRSAKRVQQALHDAGVDVEVKLLEDSTRTAPEAAAAVGCEVGAIVKSLVFRSRADGSPVLALVSGANRADEAALGVERPDAAYVREVTGYAIGGVPPVGHPARLRTVIDPDLLAFDVVWCAAGTPNALFGVAPAQLVRLTGGEERDFVLRPARAPDSGRRHSSS